MSYTIFLFTPPAPPSGGNGWPIKPVNNMKILRSFSYALKGIKACFVSEVNFKIHTAFAAMAIVLALLFRISLQQCTALLFCAVLVFTMEMINTAIEKLCDVLHPAIHPQIKIVKDIAAGAVLVAACCSVIVGAIIFLPPLASFIKNL
jgi:diacylglycerol kinase